MEKKAKFQPGRLLATPGVMDSINPNELAVAMSRHLGGDWGELCESDAALNDAALTTGNRILSAYVSSTGIKFWIITEADRSCTTALLPDEY